MDKLLFIIFGTLSVVSILFGSIALFFAFKYSHSFKDESKMIFWGIGAIAGFVFGGMCWAYFLIPIIITHLQAQ